MRAVLPGIPGIYLGEGTRKGGETAVHKDRKRSNLAGKKVQAGQMVRHRKMAEDRPLDTAVAAFQRKPYEMGSTLTLMRKDRKLET